MMPAAEVIEQTATTGAATPLWISGRFRLGRMVHSSETSNVFECYDAWDGDVRPNRRETVAGN